jgi:hypothetical protein
MNPEEALALIQNICRHLKGRQRHV